MLPQFIDLIIIFFPVYSPDMLKRLPMKDIFIELIIIFSVYSPDMPKRLPVKDIFGGLLSSIGRAVRYWFHYTLVAFAWLGVVPLTACTYFTWNNQILFKNWILISVNIGLIRNRLPVLFVFSGRIYRCLFTGSVSSLLTLPLDMLST